MSTAISRRDLLLATGAGWLAALPARAGETFSIAVLAPRADIGDIEGFKAMLAERGINARLELEVAAESRALAEAVERIRARRPDLVLTVFTPATQAAVRAITDLPVVFSSVTDPVGSGVVGDLANPGGNVTGTSHIAPAGVQIEAMAAFGLGFGRVAALYSPCEDNARRMVAALAKAAPRVGMEILPLPLPGAGDQCDPAAIPALVGRAAALGADLLYIGPDTLVASNNAQAVAEAALARFLPTFCATERPIRNARLLMGLVAPARDVGRLAALKAEEILRHRRPPGRIPVENLNRFSLLMRKDVAEMLRLRPPASLGGIVEWL